METTELKQNGTQTLEIVDTAMRYGVRQPNCIAVGITNGVRGAVIGSVFGGAMGKLTLFFGCLSVLHERAACASSSSAPRQRNAKCEDLHTTDPIIPTLGYLRTSQLTPLCSFFLFLQRTDAFMLHRIINCCSKRIPRHGSGILRRDGSGTKCSRFCKLDLVVWHLSMRSSSDARHARLAQPNTCWRLHWRSPHADKCSRTVALQPERYSCKRGGFGYGRRRVRSFELHVMYLLLSASLFELNIRVHSFEFAFVPYLSYEELKDNRGHCFFCTHLL